MTEDETLDHLISGKSIARWGDGELKVMDVGRYTRELAEVPDLKMELRALIQAPTENLLPAIPTLDPQGPRAEHWARSRERFLKRLNMDIEYGSAFITRPSSSPWIDNPRFALKLKRLWEGKRAAVVSEPESKLLTLAKMYAGEVAHIECPMYYAYQHIDDYEQKVLDAEPDVAILSCGPTATALAGRLSPHLQALDLGSAGGFLVKHLRKRHA